MFQDDEDEEKKRQACQDQQIWRRGQRYGGKNGKAEAESWSVCHANRFVLVHETAPTEASCFDADCFVALPSFQAIFGSIVTTFVDGSNFQT
jgi:hypothetical protein